MPHESFKGFGYKSGDKTSYGTPHRGDDWICDEGTPIFAVADGIVVKSHDEGDIHPSGGEVIKIEHKEGLYSYSGHLSKRYVKVGQFVRMGVVIGLSGNTGTSTAPHLHLHIQDNNKYYSLFKYLNTNDMTNKEVELLIEEKLQTRLDNFGVIDLGEGNAEYVAINRKNNTYSKIPDDKLIEVMAQTIFRLQYRALYKQNEFDGFKKVEYKELYV